jgi:hypothetical protein
MAGLSFIHLGFLAAGLAVAVPLLIHLLFRQRTRNVPIGSIRFMLQVVREHQRRRRVRQWLLLSLRALAVLLLALLFARPYLDASHESDSDLEVVVLVDTSASMHARSGNDESAFQRAQALAQRELSRWGDNVVVHLAYCDAEGVKELARDAFFAVQQPGWLATDFGLALSWARDVLATGNRSRQRLVLCTDLQRAGLEASVIPPADARVAFVVRDAGEAVTADVAMMQASVPRSEIRPGEPIKVRAVLRNGAALPARQVQVEAWLRGPAGELRSAASIDITGGGFATLDLPLDVKVAGVYQGAVTIGTQDALAWDNRWNLAFEARPPDRVLLVDGQEGRSAFGNETYFLETALRLRSNDSAERVGAFEVERMVWEDGEGFPSLNGFRAIVLANVRRLSPLDVTRLSEFVRSGGSLVFFAGDQTTTELLQRLADAGLLGGDPAPEIFSHRLRATRWDTEHPALALFNDPQRGDLRRLEFNRSFPLKPREAGRVLLEAAGEALMVERSVEQGRVIYIGWTADREWSEWPRTRMFVPLTRQLLAYATGALAERPRIDALIASRSEQQPGIESVEGRILVYNVDPREAVLDRVGPEELANAAGANLDDHDSRQQTETAALASTAGAERPREIWQYLVWGLFLVLTVELFLAGRVHA